VGSVSGDATLDSFTDSGRNDTDDGDDEDAGIDADGGDERECSEASPLAVTSTWAPDATCASCGASATRLWQDGDSSRVCAACAPWTDAGGSRSDQ